MKRIRIFPLLLLLTLLTGCQTVEEPMQDDLPIPVEEETEDTSQELSLPKNFTLPYLPGQTMDPVSCADGIQQTVGALLYEGLFELDESFAAQPRLCASSSYDAEGLVWTFTLRAGAVFSDGSPVTSADVLATLNRAKVSPRYAARFATVLSMKAQGSDSFTISLNRANALLPALLDIPIVKNKTEQSLVPTGTGPYRWDSAGPALVRNESWWGGSARPVARIELLEAKDADALLYRFSSHDVQLITADLTGVSPIRATSNVTFLDCDTTVLQYLGINPGHALLSNPTLRRALSIGINRTHAVSAFLSSHAQAAQFPISPVSSLYPQELEDVYSAERYARALEAVGLSGSHRLRLLVNAENSFKVSMANYIAGTLSTETLEVQVVELPWEEFQQALAQGNFDLYYGETRLGADWDLRRLVSAGGSLNYGGYSNAELDRLLAAFAATGSEGDADALFRFFKNEAPLLPICFKTDSVLVQEGVTEGLTPTAGNPFYGLEDWKVHLAP